MCHDFSFMAKASAATFVVVYVPAILVIQYAIPSRSATHLYIVMYLPHFVMILIFGLRMWGNLKRMFNGEPGPWTQHSRRLSVEGGGGGGGGGLRQVSASCSTDGQSAKSVRDDYGTMP